MFESVDSTEIDKIVSDPSIKEILGPLVVVETQENGVALHGDLLAVATPDSATPTDRIYYAEGGVLKSLPVLQRFRECIEPTRDLLGCAECPHKGLPCLSGSVHGVELLPESFAHPTADFDRLKDKKTVIAGHVFTSPVLLADTNEVFVSGTRKPSDIEWGAEEQRRKERKSAANIAAATRAFKKNECGNCVAKDGGCTSARFCKGAYPPPDAIQEGVLNTWLPRLLGNPDLCGGVKLEPWQLYLIMRNGGAVSDRRHKRRHVMLGGLMRSKDGFVARFTAYKGPTDWDYYFSTDWKELCEFFPALNRDANAPGAQRPSDADLAYYFAALGRNRLGAVRRGFQGYVSDPIGWLQLVDGQGVDIAPARPYFVPLSYPQHIRSWSDYYSVFADLPAEKRQTRERGY